MKNQLIILIISFTSIFTSCQVNVSSEGETVAQDFFGVSQQSFGKLSSGEEATLYTLKSPSGMQIGVTNYGAIITKWLAPDKNGNYEDVVLGFESVEDYEKYPGYYGAVVGRYGNRIAGGQFEIDGESYQLAKNNGPNNLHGGVKGFDKRLWLAEEFVTDTTAGLVLKYVSLDGEEGFPGEVSCSVIYTLDSDDGLKIDYFAITDSPTHVNLTQHSYFNLSGDMSRSILDHSLKISANEITPVDETLIPTGDLMSVEGTPFDFRKSTIVGQRINDDHEQLKMGGGYDHNFVLDSSKYGEDGLVVAAVLSDSITGRKMEVLTTEPGVQFYSGNFMRKETVGKGGKIYDYRYGLCLETQHYPDSPNQPQFPSTLLNPGEEYRTTTIYRFLAD